MMVQTEKTVCLSPNRSRIFWPVLKMVGYPARHILLDILRSDNPPWPEWAYDFIWFYPIFFTRPVLYQFVYFRRSIAVICCLFRFEFFNKFFVCLVLHVSPFPFYFSKYSFEQNPMYSVPSRVPFLKQRTNITFKYETTMIGIICCTFTLRSRGAFLYPLHFLQVHPSYTAFQLAESVLFFYDLVLT